MTKFVMVFSVLMACAIPPAFCQNELTTSKDLLEKGQAAEALDILRTYVKTSPESIEAFYLLAEVYLAVGKTDSTEVICRSLILKNEQFTDAYVLLSKALAARKEYAEAYRVLQKGLKETNNDPRLLVQKGYIQLDTDSTEAAIVSFSLAKDADPSYPAAYWALADAYTRMGADAMVVIQLEKALQLDSSQVELAHRLAKIHMANQRYNDAAKAYLLILKHDPENDKAALDLGKLYFAARQYGNALRIYEPYVQRHPEDREAWLEYAETCLNLNQYAEAKTAAEHVLSLDPRSPKALSLLGKAEYMSKNYEAAIRIYSTLNEVDTLSTEDARFLGKSFTEAKNDSAAVRYLESSLARNPEQKEILGELGAAYMRLKKWDKAVEAYGKSIAMDSTLTTAYINQALSNMALSRWEPARQALRKAVAMQPNYIKGHVSLARCLAQMDSTMAAKREYETVVTLVRAQQEQDKQQGRQSNYRAELGESYKMISLALLIEKDYPKALESLTRAVEYKPDDAELHLWRAQTLHTLDKRQEAMAEYEKVLKLDPENKDAKRGKEILQQYGL
jgi:tetratricopeptide (TPR) repeat protein